MSDEGVSSDMSIDDASTLSDSLDQQLGQAPGSGQVRQAMTSGGDLGALSAIFGGTNMDPSSSSGPLYDAVAGSDDGTIPQVDLTANGVALDAATGAPLGAASSMITSSGIFGLSWTTLAIGAVVLLVAVKLLHKV
jgi:hypothetical protein